MVNKPKIFKEARQTSSTSDSNRNPTKANGSNTADSSGKRKKAKKAKAKNGNPNKPSNSISNSIPPETESSNQSSGQGSSTNPLNQAPGPKITDHKVKNNPSLTEEEEEKLGIRTTLDKWIRRVREARGGSHVLGFIKDPHLPSIKRAGAHQQLDVSSCERKEVGSNGQGDFEMIF